MTTLSMLLTGLCFLSGIGAAWYWAKSAMVAVPPNISAGQTIRAQPLVDYFNNVSKLNRIAAACAAVAALTGAIASIASAMQW